MKIGMAQPNSFIHLSSELASPKSSRSKRYPHDLQPSQPNALATAANENFGQIRQKLALVIHRICPAWLSSQTDDLIQAALIRLLDLHRKNPARHFNASYLWKTAYSALIDEIRKCRRQEQAFGNEAEKEEAYFEGPGPELNLKARQIGEGIRESLLALSEPRRAAVTLYLQGYNVPETSKLLGWPPKKAENMVYRGLKELRQCLLGKGIQP